MSGPPRDFSGQEIVSVLRSFGYRKDRQRGSHAILKYIHPDTGEAGR
jgi:predicted RNA binding protein YcfA (HicA-like mRNA interferase family)